MTSQAWNCIPPGHTGKMKTAQRTQYIKLSRRHRHSEWMAEQWHDAHTDPNVSEVFPAFSSFHRLSKSKEPF